MPDQKDFPAFMNLRSPSRDSEPLPGPYERLCRSWANIDWSLFTVILASGAISLFVLYALGSLLLAVIP